MTPDRPRWGVDLLQATAALEAQGIQVSVALWPRRPERDPWRRLVRFSAAPYVAEEDLERLARTLPSVLAELAV